MQPFGSVSDLFPYNRNKDRYKIRDLYFFFHDVLIFMFRDKDINVRELLNYTITTFRYICRIVFCVLLIDKN